MTNTADNLALKKTPSLFDWLSMPLAVLTGTLLLGAAVFTNSFDFTQQSTEDVFRPDWQVYLRLAICGLCGLYGLFYLPRTLGEFGRFPGAWGMLFIAWSLVTVVFAKDITYSMAAAVALACMLLFAPAVLCRVGGRGVAMTVLAALVLYMLGSWFKYFVLPDLGRGAFSVDEGNLIYRLGGSPQELGIQAAWAFAFILLLAATRSIHWIWLSIPLCLVAVTLPLTQSRTGMLAAAAVLAFVLLRRRKGKSPILAWSMTATAVLAVVLMFVALSGEESKKIDSLLAKATRTGSTTELYQLTGRTEIWAYSLKMIQQAPLQGHGYGSARHALADAYDVSGYDENELHHAHNLFLNVVLTTGVIGGLLLLGMVGSQLLSMWKRPAAFPDLALVVVLVAGITEPMLFGPMPRAHTIIWLIALFWRQLGATVGDETATAADAVTPDRRPLSDPRWAGAAT